MKRKDREHIQKLFEAMLNKKSVTVAPYHYNHHNIIQRINLDGECDIFSVDYGEIILHDVPAESIKIQP